MKTIISAYGFGDYQNPMKIRNKEVSLLETCETSGKLENNTTNQSCICSCGYKLINY